MIKGAWALWKIRNDIMFNGASPRMDQALLAYDEADHWILAGAKGLRDLVADRPGVAVCVG